MGFRLFTYNCVRVIFYLSVYISIIWWGWSILCDRHQWHVLLFTKLATNENDPFALCWLVKSQFYRLFAGKVCDHPKTNWKINSRHLETDLWSILYPFSYICYILQVFTFMYKNLVCYLHKLKLNFGSQSEKSIENGPNVFVLMVSKFSK